MLDKDVLLAIGVAALAVTFFSLVIFAPGDETQADYERPAYAQDDIRYRYQQEEARNPKKKRTPPAEESFVTDGSTSAGGGGDDEGDFSNEEPPVSDHEPQEEPEIE